MPEDWSLPAPWRAGPRKVAAGKVRRKRGSRGVAELQALQQPAAATAGAK